MSVFEQAESILDASWEIMGVPVSYKRDGITLFSGIYAKMGSTLFKTDNLSSYATIRIEQRDFILKVSDVPGLGAPRKGDEIIFSGKTYMVSAPEGEPCWKWHSRYHHTQLRIHTKFIGDVDE